MEKKCRKTKWLSEEVLQTVVKTREAKSKGEKERYTHLNPEFQRRVRRDKKAFLSDQCKEIEENNRMGKTRDLFKKIRDTKGTFHAKMGSIKVRNGMDLTEAKDIKKRWQEYTELYKKDLHDQDIHGVVINDLEPDILECEVKWALESITTNKASGGDGIPVELFQILKDDAVKVLHSICQQIWKLSSGHGTGKGQFSFQSQRKAMPNNAQTTAQLYSPHMLVSNAQNSPSQNFQMFKLDLEKAEEPEIKLPTSVGSSRKQESSRKISTSALLTMPKPLTVWITLNCGKF